MQNEGGSKKKEEIHYPILNTWLFKLVGKRENLLNYFKQWTEIMDNLYLDKPDRHDSFKWLESPQQWMKPFDNEIFMLWCDYDTNSQVFQEKFDKYCEEHHKV